MSFRLVTFDKLFFEGVLNCWVESVVGGGFGRSPDRYRAIIKGMGLRAENIEIYTDGFSVYSQLERSWYETDNMSSLRAFTRVDREWYVGPYAHKTLGILWMKLQTAQRSVSYFRIYPPFYTPSKEPMSLGDFIDLRQEFSPPIPVEALGDA